MIVKSSDNSQATEKCSVILQEIVDKVSRVSGLSQLDQVTQQNAATSQEAASSAESLSQQAEMLKSSVNELIGLVNGAEPKAA